MKRLIFLFALLTLLLFPNIAHTDTYAEASVTDGLNSNIDDLLNGLDVDKLEEYLNGLSEDILNGEPLKDKIKALVTGDYSLNYGEITALALDLFLSEAKGFLPVFAVIFAICLLIGVINGVRGSLLSDGISAVLHYACVTAVLALLLTCLIPSVNSGKESINSLKEQMQAAFPVLLTLMAASGGTVSVGVFQPAVAFLSEGITAIVSDVVYPLTVLIFAFSAVGGISGSIRLSGFCNFFKSVNKWIIGVSLTLFSLFITVQGIAVGGFDGLSLRALKYAVGSGVPIVGGFLSGGVDLVLAGSALIKNSVGAVCIFALLIVIAKPIITFVCLSLLLKLASAVSEPFSDGKITAFFNDVSFSLGYFIAGLLAVAFMYFIILLLFICSVGVIF